MKTRTITMSGRAPVRIKDDEWPCIATASESHSCGQYSQNGEVFWRVNVRRHSDGRCLVYGFTTGACQCDDTETATPRAGLLLPSVDGVREAIYTVASAILPPDCGSAEGLAESVLAALPAEDL